MPDQNSSAIPRHNIRDDIVALRKKRLVLEGPSFGHVIPQKREATLNPFALDPLLICEIKRRSPSRGAIALGLDPVEQARLYRDSGVRSVSVLTEEDYFGGSLNDLMAVKTAFPDLAILRKDFLLNEDDVEISYRAGADAILLIVSMLSEDQFERLYAKARSLGLEVLVEVHSALEIQKVRKIHPGLMGINCRDLETFKMDLLLPLQLRPLIDWDAKVVFESGLFETEDARFACSSGFGGLLVGEAVVRKPERIQGLLEGFSYASVQKEGFWPRLAKIIEEKKQESKHIQKPLLKICGLCSRDDALAALEAGADILGFIFAESPRRCPEGLLESLGDLPGLKVAVVCNAIPDLVHRYREAGLVDAVQFSGDEQPEACAAMAWPYYKALRPKTLADLSLLKDYRSPRLLLDAFSPGLYGGSGKRLEPELIQAAQKDYALWLAGGITPDNVGEILRTWQPELIDIASGVEEAPGKKSHLLLKRLAGEIKNATI